MSSIDRGRRMRVGGDAERASRSKRSRWIVRAARHALPRRRRFARPCPAGSGRSPTTAGTSMRRSMRSSSGPEMRA